MTRETKHQPPDNWVYYFEVGNGTWVGDFSFKITDWKAFWQTKTGFVNRAFTLLLVAALKVFKHFKIHSVLQCYPDFSVNGIATNRIRIRKWGITFYLLEEHYVLHENGSGVYVHSKERLGPIPFLFKSRKRHPAKVHSYGLGATYTKMPILGVEWTGEYAVLEDRKSIDATLTCPYATAKEVIFKWQEGENIDFVSHLQTNANRKCETIDDVIVQLELYKRYYVTIRDARAIFTNAYLEITKSFKALIPSTSFHDRDWVLRLDVEFSKQYFQALKAYDHGEEVIAAWHTVFEAMYIKRTSVLEELILGMVAHIVNDLPLALEQTGSSWHEPKRASDFHLANDILMQGINDIQQKTAESFNPLLSWLDKVAKQQDEIFTNYGMRLSRGLAWYNAQRMTLTEERQLVLKSLGKSVDTVVQLIVYPKGLIANIILRTGRLISRWTRKWPEV
ncbi:MAG: DUF5995 family protein [Bacteroidota bacterium]